MVDKYYESRRLSLKDQIRQVNEASYERIAIDLFDFQRNYCPLYQAWLKGIGRFHMEPEHIEQIPFLPIQFFKYHAIKTGSWKEEMIFRSSGTTGQQRSSHYIRNMSWYQNISETGFTKFFGLPKDYCFLALLPSYQERKDASLVYMVDHFINCSAYGDNGFYLHNLKELRARLQALIKREIPTVLIGVSFALLDLAESFPMELNPVMIMETGGMKGRRKEMIRPELHQTLCAAFGVDRIYSEYGMTELFSQAYAWGNGRFYGADTLRAFCRPLNDPFGREPVGRTGALNLIDLANIDSCAFIATDDLGKSYSDGSFEVLGRMDGSEWRGCNLMYLPD